SSVRPAVTQRGETRDFGLNPTPRWRSRRFRRMPPLRTRKRPSIRSRIQRIRQAARSNDTRQRPLSLPEAVLICFRLQMHLLHKKWMICTKTLGSIGAMTSASQRSGFEFRFERGVSLGLKSFIARLDEFRTGVAL